MQWLLDWLFPKKCVNCGKWGKYVCEDCEVGLWEEEQICPICSRASRYGLKHKYCHRPYGLDGLTCWWAYEGVARKIISKVKYKFYYDMLNELFSGARQSDSRCSDPFPSLRLGWGPPVRLFASACAPIVVPIPLHPKRERWRGFNQSRMIAKWLGEKEGLEMRELLIRVKDTGQQVGKDRQSRLNNIKDAFKLKAGSQVPRAVLLVDDVWTSGATMSECCRVLKQAGVRWVWGWVLAR